MGRDAERQVYGKQRHREQADCKAPFGHAIQIAHKGNQHAKQNDPARHRGQLRIGQLYVRTGEQHNSDSAEQKADGLKLKADMVAHPHQVVV